jgi:PAS domain S-box-containing protein
MSDVSSDIQLDNEQLQRSAFLLGAGQALIRGEAVFRTVLDALPALYITDAAGRITYYNEAAAALWGHRPKLGKNEWCGSWKLFWPDGTPLPHNECPMALALQQKRPIRGMEAVAERPDGIRVAFIPYPTPFFDESGALIGAVNMLVDISDRRRAELDAHRLAAIVESSDDAIVSKDLNGTIVSWNAGAERLFGYKAEEVIGKPITILIPHDRDNEEPFILERIRRGERIDHYETVRLRKDGSHVEISLSVSPVKDVEGRIIGASKIARDITERKRAQEQQTLLIREMSHRVKNLFTVTSAMVMLSARSAGSPEELAKAVRARLAALARAHELTRPGLIDKEEQGGKDTTLHAVVQTIFAPYLDPERRSGYEPLIISGPDVPIRGNAITSFALILHELTTNAAKYGALSSPTGHIHVDCSASGGKLRMTWKESGGPRLDGQPKHEGFGGFLTRQIVSGQFGGQTSHDWNPEGLAVHLSVPLTNLAM